MTAHSNSYTVLHCSQQEAITHITKLAISLRANATDNLNHILRMSNIPTTSLSLVLEAIRVNTRVALHFHPDRPLPSTTATVSSSLLSSGIYKSQFETGISAGSVSAHTGGARDLWERALFAGAYNSEDVTPSMRPKYGALDLMRNDDGPAPRFGSCFFILKSEVNSRTTFTMGGSEAGPAVVGTVDEFHGVLSALMEECFTRDFCLGVRDVRPARLVERIMGLGTEAEEEGERLISRNLDSYVEAQVHGVVLLERDIEALVADDSFLGTETGRDLEAMAEKYGFRLRWRKGGRMSLKDVPVNFRGPTMPSLAARVAKDGIVDAACIGTGVRELSEDPKTWQDRGTYAEVLQELKLLWHVLVRYGKSKES